MEDKEKKEFIDGFNKGYLIRKYDLELHDNIANPLRSQGDNNSLIKGMIKGAEEAELEVQIGKLDELRQENNERDLEK